MRKTILQAQAIILIACFTLAAGAIRGSELEGLDQLTKERGLFKKTLINPDTDFSRYSKLYPMTAKLQFRSI